MSRFDAKLQPLIGNHAIEASAGTGKTYAITLLWLRLLIEEQVPIEKILVSTFTKAATAELRERLLGTLHEARAVLQRHRQGDEISGDIASVIGKALTINPDRPLEQELLSWESAFDLAHISTLHGFCEAVIRRHSMELGSDPDLELASDCQHLLEPLVDDFLYRLSASAPLGVSEARNIAKALVMELGLETGQIFIPTYPEDVADSASCAELVRELFTQAEECIQNTKTVRSNHKNGALKRLAAFHSKGKIDFTAAMHKALTEDLPEFLSAYDAYEAAIDGEHAQAVEAMIPLIRERLADEKARHGIRTFDDLLLTVRQALRNPDRGDQVRAAIRERFQAVIIDECQDSDGVQIEVFTELFLNTAADTQRSFMVIGDPKQSIYRFRGADLSSYRSLLEKTQHADAMTTNWRSDKALIEALNVLYAGNPTFADHQASAAISYVPVDAAPQRQHRASVILALGSRIRPLPYAGSGVITASQSPQAKILPGAARRRSRAFLPMAAR